MGGFAFLHTTHREGRGGRKGEREGSSLLCRSSILCLKWSKWVHLDGMNPDKGIQLYRDFSCLHIPLLGQEISHDEHPSHVPHHRSHSQNDSQKTKGKYADLPPEHPSIVYIIIYFLIIKLASTASYHPTKVPSQCLWTCTDPCLSEGDAFWKPCPVLMPPVHLEGRHQAIAAALVLARMAHMLQATCQNMFKSRLWSEGAGCLFFFKVTIHQLTREAGHELGSLKP